jgi:hypothetical protein
MRHSRTAGRKIASAAVVSMRMLACILAFQGLWGCTNWPIEPRSSAHPIGNSGGEFQQYTGAPYFHTGIDIVDDAPAPNGPYVITNKAGTAELSLIDAASLYNGMTLSLDDPDGSTQKYWHLDYNSVTQEVRDADTNGTVLPARTRVAQLVAWSACSYHHLHFETCDRGGCSEPVLALNPGSDASGPVIADVSFTNDGSTTVFDPGFPDTVLRGRVDIVARAYDRQFVTGTQNHKTGVLKIQYTVESIESGIVVKSGNVVDFSVIPADSAVGILFRTAAPFESSSDYCAGEEYYYVVTNVDDLDPANFSEAFAWDTAALPNDRYRVQVTAWDHSGNSFSLSKQVRIEN